MVYLKSLLFLILVPGSVAGLVPYLLLRNRARAAMTLAEPLQWLGLGLLGLGAAGLLWCFWDFAAHRKGTPAPVDAPRKLVVRGLYCWVCRTRSSLSFLLKPWVSDESREAGWQYPMHPALPNS